MVYVGFCILICKTLITGTYERRAEVCGTVGSHVHDNVCEGNVCRVTGVIGHICVERGPVHNGGDVHNNIFESEITAGVNLNNRAYTVVLNVEVLDGYVVGSCGSCALSAETEEVTGVGGEGVAVTVENKLNGCLVCLELIGINGEVAILERRGVNVLEKLDGYIFLCCHKVDPRHNLGMEICKVHLLTVELDLVIFCCCNCERHCCAEYHCQHNNGKNEGKILFHNNNPFFLSLCVFFIPQIVKCSCINCITTVLICQQFRIINFKIVQKQQFFLFKMTIKFFAFLGADGSGFLFVLFFLEFCHFL